MLAVVWAAARSMRMPEHMDITRERLVISETMGDLVCFFIAFLRMPRLAKVKGAEIAGSPATLFALRVP